MYLLRHTFGILLLSSDAIKHTQVISLSTSKEYRRISNTSLSLFHVDMDVSNIHIRTKRSTCDDNYCLLDAADRAQAQNVNITTRSSARLLPNCTWTTLNSPRVSTEHNYAGGVHNMSPPEPSTRSTLNCLSPLPNPILLHHFVSLFPPFTFSIYLISFSQHSSVSPLLLWWIPYSTPTPPFPIPFCIPFSLDNFRLPPHFHCPPSPTHTHSVTFAHDREL